jgi:hypothetical protein
MLRNHGWLTLATMTCFCIFGCGKSDGPIQQSGKSPENNNQSTTSSSNSATIDPAIACRDFLEALRTGNDVKAAAMLSTNAREKAAALNGVTPIASDTARFTIGKVKCVGSDGAQVDSTWSDVDDSGQYQTDNAIWVLRREEQGWRIAGVAWTVFPGEPPLLLNFEDPADMAKKQQWAREEIRRRTEQDSLQAKESENPDNSMLR